MKPERKRAIDVTLGDLRNAIADVAASVNAPVPSAGRWRICPICDGDGTDPDFEDQPCPHCGGDGYEDEDDEDFDPGDPPLFDAPLTDRQEAAQYHRDEEDNEGTQSWDNGWREEENE